MEKELVFGDLQSRVNSLVDEIANNKAKILDDFAKTYLVVRSKGKNRKQIESMVKRMELIEQRTIDGIGYIYRFRLRRGRYKK